MSLQTDEHEYSVKRLLEARYLKDRAIQYDREGLSRKQNHYHEYARRALRASGFSSFDDDSAESCHDAFCACDNCAQVPRYLCLRCGRTDDCLCA